MFSESFLSRLGVRHPIIQAPMAGVSTPALAAAVSNSGALGSLGLGASTAAQAEKMIKETMALTSAPFNVNFFCHAPAHRDETRELAWLHALAPLFAEVGSAAPEQLNEIYTTFQDDSRMFECVMAHRPAVVSFHFGLPREHQVRALKEAGIVLLASATNLQEAQAIAAAGIDAIVAQGIEAGGHRGVFEPAASDERFSTAVLVRLLNVRTSLPIIAAGGIMDGSGIDAALTLGASAAQLGTAFILCPESAANTAYRDNLKSERAATTRMTSVVSGRPARGIVNRLIEAGEASGVEPADYPIAYDAAKQLHAAAVKHGGQEFAAHWAAHWAGQGAPLARALPAEQLVRTLVAEMRKGDV